MSPAIKLVLTLGLLSATASDRLCAQGNAVPEKNETCPVLPGEPVDPEMSVQHQGKTVYFCCEKCRRKFIQDPEKYVRVLPQFGAPSPGKAAPATSMPSGSTPQDEHDHDRDHGTGIARLVSFAGRLHPLAVHFPIALILMAAGLELLGALKQHDGVKTAAGINLLLGAMAALMAAPLGWAAAAHGHFPGQADTLFWHRWLGTSLPVLAATAYALRCVAKRRSSTRLWWSYRILLAVLCVWVALTGNHGGALVFGPDHLTW